MISTDKEKDLSWPKKRRANWGREKRHKSYRSYKSRPQDGSVHHRAHQPPQCKVKDAAEAEKTSDLSPTTYHHHHHHQHHLEAVAGAPTPQPPTKHGDEADPDSEHAAEDASAPPTYPVTPTTHASQPTHPSHAAPPSP